MVGDADADVLGDFLDGVDFEVMSFAFVFSTFCHALLMRSLRTFLFASNFLF